MSNSEDKHLPASQRKLEKARADGQAARSKDLTHLACLVTGFLILLTLAPQGVALLRTGLSKQLDFGLSALAHPHAMLDNLATWTGTGVGMIVLMVVPVALIGVLSTWASGGWIFSWHPLLPSFSRVNPADGFSRLMSWHHFGESMKLMLLSLLMGMVGFVFLSTQIPLLSDLRQEFSIASMATLANWMVKGCLYLLPILVLMALIDLPLQRWLHHHQLRMGREEVKQEQKESDGNPHARRRMRSRQREIAQRQSVQAVSKADVVVLNPTHYAVALRYDDASMSVPKVIAKGTDLVAMKIREIAAANKVPTLQAPVLARALYAHTDIDEDIPAPLYTAVAQVLAYVYQLRAAMQGQAPMPGVMPELKVPPGLDPHEKEATA